MKVHAQCSTVPTALIRGINKWKPPSLTITFPSSSGDSATMFEIFWYNANNIPFPLANSVMVKLSCKQFFFQVFPAVCSFAFFIYLIFQLGKRILTFIIFIRDGTKTVKCRPLFCILWTFSSFFIGDPTRKSILHSTVYYILLLLPQNQLRSLPMQEQCLLIHFTFQEFGQLLSLISMVLSL